MTSHDLLVLGELNPDVIVTDPDPRPVFGQVERYVRGIELVIGSSSAIVACGAARLGLRVGFVGVVGDDLFGRLMVSQLADAGVDVSGCVVDPQQRTGAAVLLSSPDDRATLTFPGAIGALRAEDVPPELVRSCRHLHVSSYFLQHALRPGLPQMFRAAAEAGATTSLDSNWDPAQEWDGGLRDLLPAVDVFLPNQQEARRITGADDDETAASILLALAGDGAARVRPPHIVIKRGADGALLRTDEIRVAVPALPVAVVDTTGAGDSFDAGFLYGWIRERPLDECVRLGVVCGSHSATAVGGTAAQPTEAEALALLHQLPSSASGHPLHGA